MNQRVSDNLKHTQAAGGGAPTLGAAEHATAQLRVGYYRPETLPVFAAGVLAEIRFGSRSPATSQEGDPSSVSPRQSIHVALNPLTAPAAPIATPIEIWQAQGPVECGQDGAVRYAHDGQHLFAVIELDERRHGGILAACEFVYAEVRRFQLNAPFRHVLRMWNYADAMNEGAGDMERYRQFCVGRARGLGDSLAASYPAASAMGRQQATGSLQVYWLAGRSAGVAVENPRQISAYNYPLTYGPTSPGFSRATLAADHTLLISGTASILGHASHHLGDATAQLDEILRNLDALIAQAARHRPELQTSLAPNTYLKVYIRDPAQLPIIEEHLRQRLPDTAAMFLAADICRRELLVEIECVQTAAGASL